METNGIVEMSDLPSLLTKLAEDYEVVVPVQKGPHRVFKRWTDGLEGIEIGEVRTSEPLKAFFSRARELVAEGFSKDVPPAAAKPLAIVGAKACDLRGFQIQDFVFLGTGERDPFYARNREKNLIISADCTCAIDTCYCLAVGVDPYPETGFDLNLSAVGGSFLLEPGSEKGRDLLRENASLFKEATQKDLEERDEKRSKVVREVQANLARHDVPRLDQDAPASSGMIERNYDSELWKEEAKSCVECGACTVICPTCHCFLLYDQKDEDRMARFRTWDSCMLKDFARVAGGANPRERLWMRLRNRFEKKFDFFPKVARTYACTGCGRCISACPAKIDIRRVLKRLVHDA
jgi:heterodisulfide reductase subunit C